MKKIIIANGIKSLLDKEDSFFNRSNIEIFTTASNEETLEIHKANRADLIITNLDMPDISGEEFCSIIRGNDELRKVSIIMTCSGDKADTERISRCRANAFLTEPVDLSVLLEKAHQLLHIPKREAYRAPIGVKVEGKYENRPFLCYSENLSSSGMLFVTDKILSNGDIILCSFVLPDSTHIITDAEIIRVVNKVMEFDANQYGIRFSNIPAKAITAIKAFIEENSEDE